MFKKFPLNFVFLGISASLPYFVTGAALSRWLRVEGLDLSDIGLLSLGGLVVAFNFLWSPFINKIKIPVLFNFFGLRRSWLLISQLLLAIAVFCLSNIDPISNYTGILILILFITFLGSIQDIALDAYRVEYDAFYPAANLASTYVIGWRMGSYLLGGLIFSQETSMQWPTIYKFIAILFLVLSLTTIFSKRVNENNTKSASFSQLFEAVKNLFLKKDLLLILLFIAFYRVSDQVLGFMAYPLYTDLGFTGENLAAKNFGNFIATFFGAFLAASIINRFSLQIGLFVGAIFILITNLLFSVLYLYPNFSNLLLINFLDTIAQAFATASFLAYLVTLINRNFTAIQHAIFTSLMLVPGMILRGYSGYFVESFDYYNFFIFCGFMGIPAVLISYFFVRGSQMNSENGLKMLTILLLIVVLLLSLLSLDQGPGVNDKFIHFSAYGFIAFVGLLASKKNAKSLLIVLLIAFGVTIECLQGFSGLRNFEYMDIIANSLGTFGGLFLYFLSRNYLKKIT